MDIAQVGPQLHAQGHVDAGGGLVEDEQSRAVHQRAGDQQPPAHPARQPVRLGLTPRSEIEDAKQFSRAGPRVSLAHAEVAAVIDQHLLRGEESVEMNVLRSEAKLQAGVVVVGDHVVTEGEDPPARRADQAAGHPDERALARPVGAQQPEEAARRNAQ